MKYTSTIPTAFLLALAKAQDSGSTVGVSVAVSANSDNTGAVNAAGAANEVSTVAVTNTGSGATASVGDANSSPTMTSLLTANTVTDTAIPTANTDPGASGASGDTQPNTNISPQLLPTNIGTSGDAAAPVHSTGSAPAPIAPSAPSAPVAPSAPSAPASDNTVVAPAPAPAAPSDNQSPGTGLSTHLLPTTTSMDASEPTIPGSQGGSDSHPALSSSSPAHNTLQTSLLPSQVAPSPVAEGSNSTAPGGLLPQVNGVAKSSSFTGVAAAVIVGVLIL